MMSQVIDHGTGARARLPDGRPAAGKTGTTQAARDVWFVGFTADYVTGVWMGYDDNTPLTGTTGGGLPAEIWRETMARVEDGLPVRPLPERMPRAAGRRRAAAPRPGRGRADRRPHRGAERAPGPLRPQLNRAGPLDGHGLLLQLVLAIDDQERDVGGVAAHPDPHHGVGLRHPGRIDQPPLAADEDLGDRVEIRRRHVRAHRRSPSAPACPLARASVIITCA